jgi:hypothetical protein
MRTLEPDEGSLAVPRPADHPDFFRLPPPPGRSRESRIRLDAEGRFFHDMEPFEHAGMARAFATWIGRHPDDGRYILNNGYDWSYFEVEDVPYFVERVFEAGNVPILALSDGSEEPLEARTLELHAGDRLYVKVKRGAFDARFRQAAQIALEPWLEEEPDGSPAVVILGARYRLQNRARADRIESAR